MAKCLVKFARRPCLDQRLVLGCLTIPSSTIKILNAKYENADFDAYLNYSCPLDAKQI
jgi:hypothetical protein